MKGRIVDYFCSWHRWVRKKETVRKSEAAGPSVLLSPCIENLVRKISLQTWKLGGCSSWAHCPLQSSQEKWAMCVKRIQNYIHLALSRIDLKKIMGDCNQILHSFKVHPSYVCGSETKVDDNSQNMFILWLRIAMGAEKWDEHYVGSEYFGKLNGISYILLLMQSAVHLSQNTLCLAHLLEAILFFSSLINSHSSWETSHEEHLFYDICKSSPLSLWKNSSCSLVYVYGL